MTQPRFLKPLLLIVLVLGLAACQSSEDRAEEHYQNALRLIEEGDTDRAIVEFRNVFQNDQQHREARSDFAGLLRDLGRDTDSYRQYLRLVEQHPDYLPGRIALAQMAIENQIWDEARRHGFEAIEAAPEDPAVQVIEINLDYAQAIEDEDEPARRDVLDTARDVLAENPDDLLLQRLMIDGAMRAGDLELALEETRRALAIDPDSRQLYDTQLVLLAQLEREDEVEALLVEMIERFPDDEDLTGNLLRYYVARDDIASAETFLRDLAARAETEEARIDALAAVVQLRAQTEGVEAARAVLDEILAEQETPAPTLQVMRAGLQFDMGEQDAAIAAMEEVIAALPEEESAGEQAGQYRVVLAQMLIATGNQVGARALVEEVLASDGGQVEALKLKAGWLIEEDDTREAINLLRRALDEDADDVDALTLSARAHARNGDRDLAREFLALAASASNSAPEETLRYAEWLIGDERFFPAEEALIDALRVQPDNLQLLAQLGQLYLRMEDWSRAEQVERTLERQEIEAATQAAVQLRVARLAAQNRVDDAVMLLENIAGQNNASAGSQLSVIQGRLAAGNQEGALDYAQGLVDENPDEVLWRFALATTQSATGQYEEAIASYREILEELPDNERAWVDLVRAMNATGDLEGARAALEEALQAVPGGVNLLWAQASFRESTGDVPGAIEIYEQLYQQMPNAPIMANNLASLLSTYYDDDENLERAFNIARRLRGIEFPPFQDTYGWIAYRRGEYEEALEHLEPAAAALGDNPLVQYHLGMTYAALDRPEEALTRLRLALSVAEDDDRRPQFDVARATIAEIEAALAADEEAPATDQ